MRIGGLAFLVAVTLLGCKSETPAVPEKTTVEVSVSPELRVAQLEAEKRVLTALRTSTGEAISKLVKSVKDESQAVLMDDTTKKVSLLFSANNHGEREDCGCRKNPLGGLARRATMIDLAGSGGDSSKTWWGVEPFDGTVFVADAGDIFFKNATANQQQKGEQTTQQYDAQSVATAMKSLRYDVVNVGMLDLVFGLETYKSLLKSGGLSVVSANLADANGTPVFDTFKVVERDGKKVAFVGVTKVKPRIESYYKDRELTVLDAKQSVTTAVNAIPADVDLVVLLSNLGIASSKDLVTALRNDKVRVDLAVVSSSNRMTEEPEYAKGTPVLEPMSRGKYFGRADLTLNGKTVSFMNAFKSPKKKLTNYRRAWNNYYASRLRWNRAVRELAELELSEKVDAPEKVEPKVQEALKKRKAGAKKRATRQEEIVSKQLDGLADAVFKEMSSMTVANKRDGDDWIATVVAPVKIDLPQKPSVKRQVDAREKKRPVRKKLPAK